MRTAPTIATAATGCLLLVLPGCGGGGGGQASASPTAPSTASVPAGTPTPVPSGALTAGEATDLQYIRGLEKAGQDAYHRFAGRYTQPVFGNLAASQATQAATVSAMMARFGVPDPLRTAPAGQFADPAIQRLYNSTVESGTKSAGDALTAMEGFERQTVSDLRRVGSGTTQPDLRRMYSNLEDAANRHISACAAALQHPSPS